jgi:hypothetical protein
MTCVLTRKGSPAANQRSPKQEERKILPRRAGRSHNHEPRLRSLRDLFVYPRFNIHDRVGRPVPPTWSHGSVNNSDSERSFAIFEPFECFNICLFRRCHEVLKMAVALIRRLRPGVEWRSGIDIYLANYLGTLTFHSGYSNYECVEKVSRSRE